jgi:RNA polymerase sigma-70 factor (ECF subfamily)
VSAVTLQSGSFEELAMPLFDQLYNFAQWLTQNRDEAEDLVQETYTKALKGFSSFQLGTNFRAWMYRILRNTFLTSRTGLRVTMTVPLDTDEDGPELAVEHDTPETLLFERSNRELLQETMDGLPVSFCVKRRRCPIRRLRKRFPFLSVRSCRAYRAPGEPCGTGCRKRSKQISQREHS